MPLGVLRLPHHRAGALDRLAGDPLQLDPMLDASWAQRGQTGYGHAAEICVVYGYVVFADPSGRWARSWGLLSSGGHGRGARPQTSVCSRPGTCVHVSTRSSATRTAAAARSFSPINRKPPMTCAETVPDPSCPAAGPYPTKVARYYASPLQALRKSCANPAFCPSVGGLKSASCNTARRSKCCLPGTSTPRLGEPRQPTSGGPR